MTAKEINAKHPIGTPIEIDFTGKPETWFVCGMATEDEGTVRVPVGRTITGPAIGFVMLPAKESK